MSAHLCVSLAVTLTTQDSLDSIYKGVMVGSWKKAVSSKISSSPPFFICMTDLQCRRDKAWSPSKLFWKPEGVASLSFHWQIFESPIHRRFLNSDIVWFFFYLLISIINGLNEQIMKHIEHGWYWEDVDEWWGHSTSQDAGFVNFTWVSREQTRPAKLMTPCTDCMAPQSVRH